MWIEYIINETSMENDMEDLKNCPCCGGKSTLTEWTSYNNIYQSWSFINETDERL